LGRNVYQVIDDTTFNCECTAEEDATRYGFVRPDDPPYHLRLCKPFFDATDFVGENVSTFVHELSHFFGTRDCMDPNIFLQCPVDPDMNDLHALARRICTHRGLRCRTGRAEPR
jgi:hypothetical protein